jgi:hypothetical protein
MNPENIMAEKSLNKYDEIINKEESPSIDIESEQSEDEINKDKEKKINNYMSKFFIDVDELEEVNNDINYGDLAKLEGDE